MGFAQGVIALADISQKPAEGLFEPLAGIDIEPFLQPPAAEADLKLFIDCPYQEW